MKLTTFLLLLTLSSIAQSPKSEIYQTDLYKINFPSSPETSQQKIPSQLGELTMTIASYETKEAANDKNYVYMLMDTDYPDSTVSSDNKELLEKFFTGAIDGAVKKVNGTLLGQSEGTISNFPFRIIEIDYGKGMAVIKMKMILRHNKVIIAETITAKNNYPNAAIDSFMNSFALK